MDIVLIGTGNTAYVLGRKLKEAGHRIVQVYGREASAASQLAYVLDSESTNYWSVVNRSADLYLIAVSDIAIAEVVRELSLPDKTLVHTAASVSQNILQHRAGHYGVFYPLQTLKKDVEQLPDIPVIVDGDSEETKAKLLALAESISDKVLVAGDEERQKLHLAAVFCNNFVNHIYRLMYDFCAKENLDFNLLLPLIQESANRLTQMPPAQAQTGPALRGDTATLEKHLDLLKDYPQLKTFYELFTKSIQQNI